MIRKSILVTLFLLLWFTITSAQNNGLTVDEMVFATAVEDRQPMGADSTFSSDVERVFCFTRISGAADSTTVSHAWYYNDEEMARVELKVGAESWRTWSSKAIMATWAGRWRVDVVSASGDILSSATFTVRSQM